MLESTNNSELGLLNDTQKSSAAERGWAKKQTPTKARGKRSGRRESSGTEPAPQSSISRRHRTPRTRAATTVEQPSSESHANWGPSQTSTTAVRPVPDSQGAVAQHGEGPAGSHNGEFLPWPLVNMVENESERECIDVPVIIGKASSAETAFSSPPLEPGDTSSHQATLASCSNKQPSGAGHCRVQMPPQLLRQPGMLPGIGEDLGSIVPVALKERVWRGEYIELGQLIKANSQLIKANSAPSDNGLMLTVDSASGGLQLRPQSRSPGIRSIEQWTTAMLVYVSIYTERHTMRARELLKYMSIVRTAAECGYNWSEYDIQFRLRHAKQPEMSWAGVDTELWLLVATAAHTRN